MMRKGKRTNAKIEPVTMDKSPKLEDQLQKEDCYHGFLPREDMKTLLKANGDYLLRMSDPHANGERAIVLSMMVREERGEAGIKHLIVRQNESSRRVYIKSEEFLNIQLLLEYYEKYHLPLQKNDREEILKHPIGRQNWELLHEDIEATKKLGEGNFDIVKFYGVAAGTEPLMLLIELELVDCGALVSYISKNPHLAPQEKMEMCTQASWGIEHLHYKLVIHCDIAARNCLYGDGKVKISDFGLTREGETYKMDPHCAAPIRWLAPEMLVNRTYSKKTDVWAYGIMCWEIFAAREPYPGMTVAEVNGQLKQGYHMKFPGGTPKEFSKLIVRKCWAGDPDKRGSLSDVAHSLEKLLPNLPRPPLVAATNTEQQTAIEPKKEKAKKKGGK